MPRLFYRIGWICIPLIGSFAVSSPVFAARPAKSAAIAPAPPPEVQYDRGEKKGARRFATTARCAELPCIVTQHGAWQFPPDVVGSYRIEMGYLHEGSLRPITLFQESTTLEQKLGERLFNRYPNRKVINLLRMVETRQIPTIYMYGILLQYDLAEGDPIVLRLTDRADPTQTHERYFRFHRTGSVPDIDLSLLYPINYFRPNPSNTIQGATAGAAFSFSVGTNMDPERHYGWAKKIFRAVRFNLFTGLINRKETKAIGGDLVVKDVFDGFGGAGITLFGFLNAGYGINFVRSPHSSFPFVGIEVRNVFEFLRTLKRDTHTRWEKYLQEEELRGRTADTQ